MTQYYLSKNYNVLNNAGNKAKTDIEEILSKLGYKKCRTTANHLFQQDSRLFNYPCRSTKSVVYNFCQ